MEEQDTIIFGTRVAQALERENRSPASARFVIDARCIAAGYDDLFAEEEPALD